MSKGKKRLNIHFIGLCETCKTVVNLFDYTDDETLNGKWMCQNGHETTHLDFGYSDSGRDAKKARWVGPDGNWTDILPEDDFELEGGLVISTAPPALMW